MMSRGRMLVELALLQNPEINSWRQGSHLKEDLGDNDDQTNESDDESEHSDHCTDTDQSAACESECDEPRPNGPSYLGKDKVTEWLMHPPRPNVRTARRNIVTHLPGVKQVAKEAKTILDCWKLFFPDTTISDIVHNTNIYLKELRENYSRERDCKDTNFEEISALFGLLYLAGVKKAQHVNIEELWSDDGTAPECFRATMTMRRFYLLLRALRFDDVNDRNLRKTTDNLAPIRQVFDDFVGRCKANYQVGEYTTVDEMLEAFRGRCKFRQYIANKPAKYGIKVYALVDARMFYTANLEIYAGRQPEGPYKVDNSASSVVKRIVAPILNTGRNVTMDNYFTSLPLARDLLEKRTTIVGTLRKNKKEIPPSFLNVKDRPQYSSMFGFSKTGVLPSYVSRKGKTVLLLSTLHSDDKIDEDSGEQQKSEILTFYNLTKGGVDVVDELKGQYSVSRVSCRWPLTIFFSLLNIGGINSQIIYRENTNQSVARRVFLKTLALDLMKPHLISRSSITNLPQTSRDAIKRIAGVQQPKKWELEDIRPEFCAFCPRRKNRKTKKECNTCEKPICPEHSVYTCPDCVESAQE